MAGQVDYAMHQPNCTTVLVGFNPVTLARDTPIEKWHKTCKDVGHTHLNAYSSATCMDDNLALHMHSIQTFLELEQLSLKSDRAVILNPVVGPEPITGTSVHIASLCITL